MDYYRDGDYFLELKIRNPDGTTFGLIPSLYETSRQVSVMNEHEVLVEEFVWYSLVWPQDSAMTVTSMWKDRERVQAHIATDTTIVVYNE